MTTPTEALAKIKKDLITLIDFHNADWNTKRPDLFELIIKRLNDDIALLPIVESAMVGWRLCRESLTRKWYALFKVV